ncbi:MAG: adenosine deaminase, partial [Myxococcaceae bacterium]
MASIHEEGGEEQAQAINSTERRPAYTITPPTGMEVTEELLRALPKTDLHCHLDGSMRLSTILDLAEKQKVKLP